LKLLGLRIDVDTYAGGRHGLPRLLELLDRYSASATLCIPSGPDRTAGALFRIFTQPGYAAKLWRTRAWMLYGASVLGTALPQRKKSVVDLSESLIEAAAAGHEVAAHGFGHTSWHNSYHRLGIDEVRAQMKASVDAIRERLGIPPVAFGAPGWQAGFASLKVLDELGLQYGSDTRGSAPFLPRAAGVTFNTPQVPTTLPTLDEFLGGLPPTPAETAAVFDAALGQDYPVYTAHPELEGRFFTRYFEDFLAFCMSEGIRPVPLSRLLSGFLDQQELPVCGMVQKRIPGRPGFVAAQECEEPT